MGDSSAKAIAWFDSFSQQFNKNYEDCLSASFVKLMLSRIAANPLDIFDLGAGTGIVAEHLASLGHRVVAVEPSAGMRAQANATAYTLLDDRLPALKQTKALGRQYDVIIEIAVRMFLDTADRRAGFANAVSLLKPGGLYFTLVKHSPFAPERGAYDVTEAEVLALAAENDLAELYNEPEPDLRGRTDVSWRGYLFSKQVKA